MRGFLILIVVIVISSVCAGADPAVSIGEAVNDAGVFVHEVTSPFQAGKTRVRVLCPDQFEKSLDYSVIYVLPVEAGNEHRYGDGLAEVKRLDLHNKYRAIFVTPEFSHLPWYADHPTDPEIRQESYFIQVVLPLVETRYPARKDAGGRLLLGFSKSGWGAFSLLLRHPDTFGKAAIWDAPLMLDQPGRYGSGPIFGTPENFHAYQVSTLLQQRAPDLTETKRLAVLGYGGFRDQHEAAHALMQKLHIAHDYHDGPPRKHIWESGWLSEAVELLAPPAPAMRQGEQ